jgi:hypothetical protein
VNTIDTTDEHVGGVYSQTSFLDVDDVARWFALCSCGWTRGPFDTHTQARDAEASHKVNEGVGSSPASMERT